MLSRLRRRVRRPSAGTIMGFTALVLAVSGVSYAAIPTSGGRIDGCYQKPGLLSNPGAVRVIDAERGQQCRSNETALAWNQQGPKGDRGRDGAPGPPGPSEARVFERVGGALPQGDRVTVGETLLPPAPWTLTATVEVESHDAHLGVHCYLTVDGAQEDHSVELDVRIGDPAGARTWTAVPLSGAATNGGRVQIDCASQFRNATYMKARLVATRVGALSRSEF